MLTESQLRQIMPALPLAKLQQYLPFLNDAMQGYEINTLLRTAAFAAQTAHESAQYTRMLESLFYTTTAGLMLTWPKRFPTEASALPYLRNEQKLGNFVYANRMGNGDAESGDGFRYRGRGVIQLTGREAYRIAGAALGLDLVAKPELVQMPEAAFLVAGLYWKSHGLNGLADRGEFKAITQIINGGQKGAAERLQFYETAKRVLGSSFVATTPATRGAPVAPVIRSIPPNMGTWSRGWQDGPDDEVPATEVPAAPTPAKKAVGKKAAPKKAAVKKAAVKKAAVAKKAAPKKPAVKKAVAKKVAAKVPARKAPAKKLAVKKVAVKKAPAKKAPAKQAAAKKFATP